MKPLNPLPRRLTLAVDFDGVIHRYSKGWHTKDIYDPPMDGAFDALEELFQHYNIFIFTARPSDTVVAWCNEQCGKLGIDLKFELIGPEVWEWNSDKIVGVTNRKLPALAYIDDRAVRFTNWQDMLAYFR
jgi:hypothetical protein